jgi:hypothetical protein
MFFARLLRQEKARSPLALSVAQLPPGGDHSNVNQLLNPLK